LSGIKFHVGKSGSSLKLLNSWRNYGSGYAPATYHIDRSGFCTLGGLIRGTQLSDLVQLPNSCRPKERLLMNVNSSGGRHARVDIMPTGQVRWIRGKESSWISLAGLTVSATVSREPASQATAEARLIPRTVIGITPIQQAQMTEYLNAQNTKIGRVLTDQDRKSLQQLAAEIQAAQLLQNTRERASQFDAINTRYGSLRKDIMNRANIANEDIYARLAAIAPELDLRIDQDRISSLRRGALDSIRTPTELPAEELTEFPETFMNPVCGDLSLTSPARRRGVAHEYTQDTFLVGGCRVDTGIGSALTVPPNVSRVHVQVDLSSLVAISSAAFGIAGYAQANTDLGIHIAGPGLSQFDMDRSVIAIAPVAFAMLADDRRNEVQVLRTSFVPLQEGGEYRIFLYTGHFTLGVPFPLAPATAALSMATVFNLDKITARFQR
jgi:hypothetical protein